MTRIVIIGGGPAGNNCATYAARFGAEVVLSDAAIDRMAASRAVVARLAEGEPKYGISTGFGALATVAIPPERRRALQVALVRSHAAGMGDPVEDEVVRAMVFLRARTLALGYSGTRPVIAETMVALLNAGITPLVPEYGSLGASGDLAPLSHAAMTLLGEGQVRVTGTSSISQVINLARKAKPGSPEPINQ